MLATRSCCVPYLAPQEAQAHQPYHHQQHRSQAGLPAAPPALVARAAHQTRLPALLAARPCCRWGECRGGRLACHCQAHLPLQRQQRQQRQQQQREACQQRRSPLPQHAGSQQGLPAHVGQGGRQQCLVRLAGPPEPPPPSACGRPAGPASDGRLCCLTGAHSARQPGPAVREKGVPVAPGWRGHCQQAAVCVLL